MTGQDESRHDRTTGLNRRRLLAASAAGAALGSAVSGLGAALRGLAHSGMTMLVVSHEMHFVRDIATRVVFMDGGRIAEEGPPGEILMRPRSARLVSFLNRFHGTGSQPAG